MLLFSRSVVSDSLQPHGLQSARLSCPSLSCRVCSNSCPFSRWCHPTISSSIDPLLLLPSIIPSIRVLDPYTHQGLTRQTPLSMGFSTQEYWSGLPCPPPGDLPDWGIQQVSLIPPSLAGGIFSTSTTWEVQPSTLPPLFSHFDILSNLPTLVYS